MKGSSLQLVARQRGAVLAALKSHSAVDAAALSRAELVAARTRQPVEQALNQLGGLSDDDLVALYSTALGIEIWNPSDDPPLSELKGLNLTSDYLRRARVLVLTSSSPERLVCAACDPLDQAALHGLSFASGKGLTVKAARPDDWRRALDATYVAQAPDAGPLDERRLERDIDLLADRSEAPGSRLVAEVFDAAVRLGASDIHFEPRRHDLLIRLRIDGRMVQHAEVAADLAQPAVSRVKVIANLDLGERRLPQDGRTTFVIGGKPIDVRVATSPTVFGESAVLRILDRTSVPLDLDALGLNAQVASVLRGAAASPHGLFLVTGPTGSGKTTTLYALLQTFAGSPRKVLSVEDPVEFHFEHVSQTQVAPAIGLTFAAALRSFLRQDPDVILVGEIRDPETAAVAIQAAMTGHLVLASIHANDALGVVPRLLDMGIESYQIAAGFRGAVAQRLVRRLCPHCSASRPTEPGERALAEKLGRQAPLHLWAASGCPHCKGAGFKGRIAISEGFAADDLFVRAVAQGASAAALNDEAARCGLAPMAADGFAKAVEGVTSREEVMAAIHDR